MNRYFSFILHAHLPYVRHQEKNRLEENWLFEAISECYIPLLWLLEEQEKRVPFTISFSTPLMEMLSDPLMQRRYLHTIEKLELLIDKELARDISELEKEMILFYEKRIERIKKTFRKWDQNLLHAFRYYLEQGKLTCICSSATHALLPYLQTNEGLRSQIRHGIECFDKHFGFRPKGFWLPECAYSPGIDRILFEEEIQYTFVDEHALQFSELTPTYKTVAPVFSPHGIMLFPRNSQMTNQVWSSVEGYPGDEDYREFYRDIAYEREWDYIKPFMHPEGIRYDTGLKMNRITGKTENKQLYNREQALNKVKQHSEHFYKLVEGYLHENDAQVTPPPIIITPFDAELFGHWWFEGPDWIAELMSQTSINEYIITPEEYANQYYKEIETANVSFSTWGRNGYGEVWLNDKNCWIYRHLHRLEKDLIRLITDKISKSELENRCLMQMVREWMLAASSDWSFILDNNSASQYANDRINEHISRYNDLRDDLINENLKEEVVTKYEAEYPFINKINLEVFISTNDEYVINRRKRDKQRKSVLMLAWEFPPMMVGGLSRHVYDLSKKIVTKDWDVHVITTAVEGSNEYQVIDGIYVHRVGSLQPKSEDFYHWVGGLNVAITEHALKLVELIDFDLIHAHDWLVCVSAKVLKHRLHLPIVATIHATEHGRNFGIWTSLQKAISHKEWELTYEASKVIVCSQYMEKEIRTIFDLPEDKIEIIHNGVDLEMVSGEGSIWKQKYGSENDLFIFSVGRIVKEKGFQTIIDSAPLILAKHPNVKFIVAGKGPLLKEYRNQVKEKKLEKSVFFIGFVDDQLRNEILNGCQICLFPSYYEPFGIVALESMIAGKPTIVSDTGGLSEIITHGETGLKIYPKDVESLVNQVITCIEDKELQNKISINGKEHALTQYSWDHLADKTIAVYEASMNQN